MKNKLGLVSRLLALGMTLMLLVSMVPSAMAETAATAPTGKLLVKYLTMDENATPPPVTFQFAVTPGTPKDATPTTPQILAGTGAPTIEDISFTAASSTSKDNETGAGTTPETTGITVAAGTKYAKGTGAIDFGTHTFDAPGVYRYEITESIKTGGGDGVTLENPATRIMDVYVTSDGAKLTAESLIIHKNDDNIITGTGVTEKDYGFINDYVTHDLSLTKHVTGNQGFRSKLYKFTVSITGAMAGTQYVVDGNLNPAPTGEAAASTSPLTVGADGTVTGTFYLSNAQTINIRGLTEATSYTITEQDYAVEGYTTTFTQTGVTGPTTHTPGTTAKTIGKVDNAVEYDNNRNGVVPTGILLDIWPYILIVAVAVVALIVLMRGKRKHTTRH